MRPGQRERRLTPRQETVLRHIVILGTVEATARTLHVGKSTVYHHLTDIRAALDLPGASIYDVLREVGWLNLPDMAA